MTTGGFQSPQARQKLRLRAWLIGAVCLLLQSALPLFVVVSALSLLASSCSAALTGPRANASGASVRDGRIWFAVNAPVEEVEPKATGKQDRTSESPERRMLLMSADPDGGEPRLEQELRRSRGISLFDRADRLVAAGQQLFIFDKDGARDTAGAPTIDYPPGAGRGRPFVLDDKPALTLSSDGIVTVMALDGVSWRHIQRLSVIGLADDVDWQTLSLMRHKKLLFGAALSFDKQLFLAQQSDAGLRVTKLASEVDDFALAVVDDTALIFHLTAGPGLEDLIDDLEDVERPAGEERPKTMLVAHNTGGSKLWARPAAGADQLAALTLKPDSLALVSEHGGGIEVRRYRNGALAPTVTVLENEGSGGKTKLIGLMLLWLFGGGFITLITAMAMASGMRSQRNPDEVQRFASLTRRAIARGVDTLMLVAAVAAVVFATGGAKDGSAALAQLVGMLVAVVLLVVEARTGSSPGKRLCGIVVQDYAGQPPGLRGAFTRSLLSCVDGLFGGLIGILTIAFSPHWQRVGDSVANTVVVRRR